MVPNPLNQLKPIMQPVELAVTKRKYISLDEVDGTKEASQNPFPPKSTWNWVALAKIDDFPADGGNVVLFGNTQIAIFKYSSRGEWYASQNMCPNNRGNFFFTIFLF